MSRIQLPTALALLFSGGSATADVPSVAVDIAPLHSLVSRVMEGVGTPDLIIPAAASPHEYTLRPSEAAAIELADLVFWIGSGLTPWLEGAVETLAGDANVISLLQADGTVRLELRQDAVFELHSHDDHAEDNEANDRDHSHEDKEHEEEDHDEHDHADKGRSEEDHAHDHQDHGAYDPHAWLSPDNARTWLNLIAAQLSSADPENAGAYFANAASGREEIDALITEISTHLDEVRSARFVVFHDAYQYFEQAFDFYASGAIAISDASEPSPARIAEIQERVRDEGVDCILAEPQFNPSMVATVLEGTEAATGVIDPIGSDLELGVAMYPILLRNMSTVLVECLK